MYTVIVDSVGLFYCQYKHEFTKLDPDGINFIASDMQFSEVLINFEIKWYERLG